MRDDLKTVPQVGDKVLFWTLETGLQAQHGTIQDLFEDGIPYATIIPDTKPDVPVYLCHHAVWGYEVPA